MRGIWFRLGSIAVLVATLGLVAEPAVAQCANCGRLLGRRAVTNSWHTSGGVQRGFFARPLLARRSVTSYGSHGGSGAGAETSYGSHGGTGAVSHGSHGGSGAVTAPVQETSGPRIERVDSAASQAVTKAATPSKSAIRIERVELPPPVVRREILVERIVVLDARGSQLTRKEHRPSDAR